MGNGNGNENEERTSRTKEQLQCSNIISHDSRLMNISKMNLNGAFNLALASSG
jgi:hypothetical protein